MPSAYILIPAMVLSLVLVKLNQHYASPVLAIIIRWVRWGVMAAALAEMFQHMEWSERDYTVLFLVFFIGWFLLDGIYRWLSIHAMSVSPLPLFPRFSINKAGDEWPVQARFLKLRDLLRSAGFKQVQALRAEVATSFYVRLAIFQDTRNESRLQVAFLPQPFGNVTVCWHFATQLADGRKIVTDNHYLPFGGFYPENWLIERRPNNRSFSSLLKRHRERIGAAKITVVPWTTEPVDDLNAQQGELERINTELGFLLPHTEHEEFGRISHEGRYRLWKEMLSLNYFGRSARYE